jgi:hypothetical protein
MAAKKRKSHKIETNRQPDFCNATRQNHRVPRGFWSAVAERSGDTALGHRPKL